MTRGLLVKNTNNGEKAEFWRCQYEDVRRTGLILVPDDPAEHQEQHGDARVVGEEHQQRRRTSGNTFTSAGRKVLSRICAASL
jgi:hypothetical protein